MKQINYSIFDKYPTRNTPLWKKGAPKIPLIDRELRQNSKDAPILIRDEMDNLISRNCYHMINSYFISNNCYININNLRLKSVLHKNVFMALKYLGRRIQLQISGKQECLQIFGNPDVISTWKNYLSKYTIQRNFYKKYQVQNRQLFICILKMIGKGSHAKVYKIERIQDSSIFAVKIFKSEKLTNKDKGIVYILCPHLQDSILKEIDIMRKFDNKNVLQLHEIFEDENNVYLIVDYLQGGELLKQIENSMDGYTEHLVQNLMYNLLSSLNYIHSKQIIHRDIKPENLILRSKGCLTDLVIADFGLSDIYNLFSFIELYNEQGVYLFQRCGTVGYVAPEVLRDQFYDYKVDMFSVGVILFILLTGEMPFESNSDTDNLLKQNAQCQIDFNKLNQKSISPAAQDLVRLLLDENLNIRPNASQALLHDWFATPKTDTIVSLSLTKLPIFQIRLDQDDFIKSSTPLWDQKGSPLSEQSPLFPENSSELEDEANYFKQFISTGQDQYEIGEDCINEEKSPSEMVPKYRLLVKQRSLN